MQDAELIEGGLAATRKRPHFSGELAVKTDSDDYQNVNDEEEDLNAMMAYNRMTKTLNMVEESVQASAILH